MPGPQKTKRVRTEKQYEPFQIQTKYSNTNYLASTASAGFGASAGGAGAF